MIYLLHRNWDILVPWYLGICTNKTSQNKEKNVLSIEMHQTLQGNNFGLGFFVGNLIDSWVDRHWFIHLVPACLVQSDYMICMNQSDLRIRGD